MRVWCPLDSEQYFFEETDKVLDMARIVSSAHTVINSLMAVSLFSILYIIVHHCSLPIIRKSHFMSLLVAHTKTDQF